MTGNVNTHAGWQCHAIYTSVVVHVGVHVLLLRQAITLILFVGL